MDMVKLQPCLSIRGGVLSGEKQKVNWEQISNLNNEYACAVPRCINKDSNTIYRTVLKYTEKNNYSNRPGQYIQLKQAHDDPQIA